MAYPLTPNTGTLIAEGTAERPIRFTGIDGGKWGHVLVEAPGVASFRHVTFENGGNDRSPFHATLIVRGKGDLPLYRDVLVDHVTISGSVGFGAVFTGVAGFKAGSTDLAITKSGSGDEPFPLRVDQNGVGTVPNGNYTGNGVDEILIAVEKESDGLRESTTFRDFGVPYRVAGQSLRVEEGPSGATVLRIDPGVVLKFERASNLEVVHFTGREAATASLVAVGTAEKPILFTSAAESPRGGDWRGLWFGKIPSKNNKLDHVRIEYAGADCKCVLAVCNDLTDHSSALILTNLPEEGFSVTNTAFSDIAGNGILRAWSNDYQPSFVATNTFERVTGCAETLPASSLNACPNPKPTCP
ncbi:hypothetical protein [Vulgatibacter incomptus]|uniref:Fibronectin type III domain protein n=1 Tax=Vulgatibacter incomptus TaxID=1391653 RepID=A0A0K1PG07_9BACT|nr:hypothetical protein [Vulgatibacter incomptus]AKU92468.1 Fibronectin type III domain protein [Vulgatibacter incomptus]